MSRYAHQLAEVERRYADQRPLSRELHDRARAVMPGGSTRSVLDVRPFPFRVASAHGSRITDVDGHEYLDTLGDYSAGLLGHDAAPVAAAVRKALDTGWSYGGVHTDEIRFAEAIVDRFASIDRVRFTNSGTEANLMAIQLARHHTGRDRVVVCDGAYHGGLLYFGAGGDALVAPFDITRITFNDVDGVDTIDSSVAAVVVEPMMGAAGCIPASTEFLAALRARCDATGALLIFDEVMTSRMSAGGQQARVGIYPDLTTLGKYMAGGMTFGAFGGTAAVMDAFDPASGGTLTHGGTFNNNVVSMAAGVATLGEMLSPTVLDELFARGEALRHRLNDAFGQHGVPLCVSGLGSMMNIHPSTGPITTPADVANGDPDLRQVVFHEFLHRGVYMAPRGYMALTLAFGDDDSDTVVAVAHEVAAALG